MRNETMCKTTAFFAETTNMSIARSSNQILIHMVENDLQIKK